MIETLELIRQEIDETGREFFLSVRQVALANHIQQTRAFKSCNALVECFEIIASIQEKFDKKFSAKYTENGTQISSPKNF